MEYQKRISLLDDITYQTSKFRTRNWVEVNHESKGVYSSGSEIKFETSMIMSTLCDYSGAYIHGKAAVKNTNKKLIFENCAPFTKCISRINYAQVDDGQAIDRVMPVYNLIEYSDAYLKTSESLWQ